MFTSPEMERQLIEQEMVESILYRPDFQVEIESFLNHLKASIQGYIPVTPAEAYRFEYDYHALLRYKNVPYKYHWIVMRVNGFNSPFEGHPGITEIQVPDYKLIEKIFEKFINTRGFM